jgi:hypothetical protein
VEVPSTEAIKQTVAICHPGALCQNLTNSTNSTPIDIADIRRLDQAVDLLTELIIKSGAKPKALTKR